MPKISSIKAHKIVNSRGTWTIVTKVELDDGSVGVQAVPEGASKGENEAVYLDTHKAMEIVSGVLDDALHGEDPFDQKNVDSIMLELDGTENKAHLGGNSILSVSLAVCRAAAASKKVPLYVHIAEIFGNNSVVEGSVSFPTPVFNILNGGKHAHNGLSFQEFMVIPARAVPFEQAYEMGVDIYGILKKRLSDEGYSTDVGDEGGFAPENFTVDKAFSFLRSAAKKYKPGENVFFGSDVAAESFFKKGKYFIEEESITLTPDELHEYHKKVLSSYEIIYYEDPFFESSYKSWTKFTKDLGEKVLVVADDLVVTNPKYLKRAIKEKMANSVIVKPNQVGSLSETFEFVRSAQEQGWAIIVSHRSGDVGADTFIADLAIGVGADFIKSGAPARGERVVKYNRLLDVYYDLYPETAKD